MPRTSSYSASEYEGLENENKELKEKLRILSAKYTILMDAASTLVGALTQIKSL